MFYIPHLSADGFLQELINDCHLKAEESLTHRFDKNYGGQICGEKIADTKTGWGLIFLKFIFPPLQSQAGNLISFPSCKVAVTCGFLLQI